MKKLLLVALAAIMCVAIVAPASAFENEFGGYWRFWAENVSDYKATDTGSQSIAEIRTRLYYTAKFSDDFKFVNKFEIDNVFGDPKNGDIGADNMNLEVKNTYADFNTAGLNFKIGTQGGEVARGFLFCDDFSGITITKNSGNNAFSLIWAKTSEVDSPYNPTTTESDYYIAKASLAVSPDLTVSPYLFNAVVEGADTSVYALGADIDMKMGANSAWATLIYETGKIDDNDLSAYLVAVGADAGIIHGQVFYASGDDDADDPDMADFQNPAGASYYWAEILGYGSFDDFGFDKEDGLGTVGNQDQVTNVMAANLGVTIKPMKKLTVSADLWYAQLAEDNDAGDKSLGTEIDLKATYNVMENLDLSCVAAYLSADDAAGTEKGAEDPMEFGAELTFSF